MAKNLLDTPLSNNAQLMLGIMTDMVLANEKDNTSFEILGPILQKHLQVSDEEVEALTELFKANMREMFMNHPEGGRLPNSLLPGTEDTE